MYWIFFLEGLLGIKPGSFIMLNTNSTPELYRSPAMFLVFSLVRLGNVIGLTKAAR
jgi:hypothetical protein